MFRSATVTTGLYCFSVESLVSAYSTAFALHTLPISLSNVLTPASLVYDVIKWTNASSPICTLSGFITLASTCFGNKYLRAMASFSSYV